ncbi:hypothetical protein D9M73_254230 [compost metagenome]
MLAMVANDDAGYLTPRGDWDPIASMLNWSSNPGHRLRCLCRFLLHGYWRQVVVVAMEPGAVVVHEEAHHIGFSFLNQAVAATRHPL